jgi:type II secretory pathway pseudopilin PulG
MKCRNRNSAFSLTELVVVLGIVMVLTGLLLPSMLRARESALRITCSMQLSQIGKLLNAYANDYGWLPRDYTRWYLRDGSGAYLAVAWYSGYRDAKEEDLRRVKVLTCPSHPLAGDVPATYPVNAIAIVTEGGTARRWSALYSKPGSIRNSSEIVYMTELRNWWRGSEEDDRLGYGAPIFIPSLHDIAHIDHLPGRSQSPVAVSPARHGKFNNALMFDFSVRAMDPRDMTMRDFDDRQRGLRAGRILFDWATATGVMP